MILFVLTTAGMLTINPPGNEQRWDDEDCLAIVKELNKSPQIASAFCLGEDDNKTVIKKQE